MFKKKQKKDKAHGTDADAFFGPAAPVVTNDDTEKSSDVVNDQPEWIDQEEEEGQLAVDVYEEGDAIIVKSTIAGIEPDDVDISMDNDMLTIRGERKREKTQRNRNFFFQECYWGAFSRSVILPVEIDVKKIDATIKNGILTIFLPKLEVQNKKSIKIKEEE